MAVVVFPTPPLNDAIVISMIIRPMLEEIHISAFSDIRISGNSKVASYRVLSRKATQKQPHFHVFGYAKMRLLTVGQRLFLPDAHTTRDPSTASTAASR